MVKKMLFLFSFMQMLLSILAFERGDRISTALQTLHGGWRTPFIDIAIHQMPKFQTPDSTIMSVSLPHKGENEPEMKLDPTDNVYVSISFAHNKLLLPRLVLFDASTKRSMETVTITFSHDDFDVLRISHHVTYSPRSRKFDPSHPSLTAFNLIYKWEAVQEQDLGAGVMTMFVFSLLCSVVLIVAVARNYDRGDASGGSGGSNITTDNKKSKQQQPSNNRRVR